MSYELISRANSSNSPWKQVVRIEVDWSDNVRIIGSGVLIGANDVLTAAHVFNHTNPLAHITQMRIYPGYNSSTSSSGYVTAASWEGINAPNNNSTISQNQVDGDVGIITLRTALGLQLGYWDIGGDFTVGTAELVGYPSTQQGAMTHSTGLVTQMGSYDAYYLSIADLYVKSGSSGGPIFINEGNALPTVIGVISTEAWGVSLTSNLGINSLNQIQAWISDNNHLIADALPVISTPNAQVNLSSSITSINLYYDLHTSDSLAYDQDIRVSATSLPNGVTLADDQITILANQKQGQLRLQVDLNVLAKASTSQTAYLHFYQAETAVFTNQQNSADVILNLSITNLGGSSMSESVVLSNTTDRYAPGNGNDTVDGGLGTDTIIYESLRNNYHIEQTNDHHIIITDTVGNDGQDECIRVERLQFKDKVVAYDVKEEPGDVVKLINVLFGHDFLTDELIGIGMHLFQTGYSYNQIIDLALNTPSYLSMAGGSDYRNLIKTLYLNVTGQVAAESTIQMFLNPLIQGSATTYSLIELAANHELNIQLIGLNQLEISGIQYALIS